jgi:lipid II:glycine glycyltransferase (peptidoglycan interpeptide bridge formation enzyme)
MRLHQIDPVQDARWGELVQRHPKASVFQTVGWLEALQRTYGYSPVVFTTSPSNGRLENGVVFCHVRSWLTGDRMVSLPFSDHCEPLFDSKRDLRFIMEYLQANLRQRNWKYIEVRPVNSSLYQPADETGFRPAKRYCFHHLDLRHELDYLFRSLDRDSAQRRILRAERAGVVHECGTSVKLLKDFYSLLVLTRRRHHFPPQPYLWFRNLVDCMKEALEIRVAYKAQIPIAAVLTLRFRNTIYYKYGCSDAKFKHLGGMPLLLWKTIEKSKAAGSEEFDLGRSDTDNSGLISFKNHWAQVSTELVYWRFPAAQRRDRKSQNFKIAKSVFACLPKCLLTTTGRLLYRHIG